MGHGNTITARSQLFGLELPSLFQSKSGRAFWNKEIATQAWCIYTDT